MNELLLSINEQELENNQEDKQKAIELLQVINERINKIEIPNKREIGDKLNSEISTGAKLKLTIPLIPGILQYESDLIAFSAKEPIKSWKDLWEVFFRNKGITK